MWTNGLREIPTWQPIGVTIPANTWAKVRLENLLLLSRNAAYVNWCTANNDPLGDGCAPNPYNNVWELWPLGVSGYLGVLWGCQNSDGTVTAYSLNTFGADFAETNFNRSSACPVVWRRRPYHHSGFAIENGAPADKFDVGGQQKIIVSPIWVEARASSTQLAPGVSVSFTARASGPLRPFSHGSGTATIVWAYGENPPAGPLGIRAGRSCGLHEPDDLHIRSSRAG